jgi:hypothetical protein
MVLISGCEIRIADYVTPYFNPQSEIRNPKLREYRPRCRVDGQAARELSKGADDIDQARWIERAGFPIVIVILFGERVFADSLKEHHVESCVSLQHPLKLLSVKITP